MKITKQQMRSLPSFFKTINDPRRTQARYTVPSLSIIRDVLTRVDPSELEAAFIAWNNTYVQDDESLAIDGKIMCNAIDEKGRQTQIMSAAGHSTGICYAQKK